MKNNEVLWEQSLDASLSWLFMGIEITFLGFIISMIFYSVYQVYKYGVQLDSATLLEFVEIGVYGVVYTYSKINQFFVGKTLSYQIKSDTLIYNWGVRKGTTVEIPFKDITAINLVEYHSKDYATIYVVTKEDYKLHKLNFDNNSPRHTYTLEKVKKGPVVYQLMMERWELARA